VKRLAAFQPGRNRRGAATDADARRAAKAVANSPLVKTAFYGGDAEEVEFVGPPRDYYSWEWGDALFVVVDYYWHSPVPITGNEVPGVQLPKDPWRVTMGDAQYRWLKRTLEASRARWKFVFAHHVLGLSLIHISEPTRPY
jgi:phosphodiesterase/alkaline phosphatase D-like protein